MSALCKGKAQSVGDPRRRLSPDPKTCSPPPFGCAAVNILPVVKYVMSNSGGQPPFLLPEYARALARFVHEGIGRLMEAKDPLFGMIPKAAPTPAVPTTQNTMPSGEVVQSSPVMMAAKFVLRYDDMRSSSADALAEQMDSAADQNLSVVMRHLFDLLARTCQAAGTAFDAGGKPFSFDVFLSGLENIEISFDADGKPELPTMVMGPQMAEQIRALPPVTPEQQKRLDELIERKRKEHYARRRHRKLR